VKIDKPQPPAGKNCRNPNATADAVDMSEALVGLGWRIVLGGLVAAGGVIAAALLYQGVLAAISLRWPASVGPILAGAAIGMGVFILCRHRNDLICD